MKPSDESPSLAGRGWSLWADEFRIARCGADRRIPLDEIASVGTVSSTISGAVSGSGVKGIKLGVWIIGEDDPVAELPLTSKAVRELRGALAAHLAQRTPDHLEDGSIGPVLFERRSRKRGAASSILGFLALAAFVGVPVLLSQDSPYAFVLAGGGFALLAMWWVVGRLAPWETYRCHDRGVSYSFRDRHEEITFPEIEWFSCSTRAVYMSGSYQGAFYELVFDPFASTTKTAIRFEGQLDRDDDIEDYRNVLSAQIADRLRQQLVEHGHVPWTPEVQLTNDGLTRERRGHQSLLPWTEVSRYEVREGKLHISQGDGSEPVVEIPCGAPNFYAGLILFDEIARAGD